MAKYLSGSAAAPLAAFAVALSLLTAAPAAMAAPPKEAVVQADGITNRVIDQVWENTDHYWHNGDYNRCVSLIRVCMEADPSFYEAVSVGAWLLWSMDDKPAADALLQRSVQIAPNKWAARYTFGEQLYVRRQYAEAIPHFEFATQYKNAPALAWSSLANSYNKLKRYDKAVATWQQVVKRFPDYVAGPHNLKKNQELLAEQQKAQKSSG